MLTNNSVTLKTVAEFSKVQTESISKEGEIAMCNDIEELGGRLPLANYSALSPTQKELFNLMTDSVIPRDESSGFLVRTEDGRFIGPLNPALLTPEISSIFMKLQFAESSHTSLSDRVRQVIILTVGAVWKSDYELYAHSAVARKAGLSDDWVHSLAGGILPDGMSDQEKIAHEIARQLSEEHQLDEELYRKAEQMFRASGILDIVLLVGIYHTVCATLNAFAIPAPRSK